MSHTTTIKTKYLSPRLIEITAQQLGLEYKIAEKNEVGEFVPFSVRLYQQQPEMAVATVKLPGWQYPIAIQANGEVRADNFNGRWGSLEELDKFAQAYSTQVVLDQMQLNGDQILSQTVTEDGMIRIAVQPATQLKLSL